MTSVSEEQRLDHRLALMVLARGMARRRRTGFYAFIVMTVA